MPVTDADYQLFEGAPESLRVLEDYANRSAPLLRRPGAAAQVSYGDHPRECMDILLPAVGKPAPFVLFIHGGWWKAGHPSTRLFLAPAFLDRGIAFVSVGYPLAPGATLPEIAASIARAITWLAEHGPGQGLDLSRIVVAGNSAGAHLATFAGSTGSAGTPWSLPSAPLGICALSGLYDLEPLRGTFAQDWLALSGDIAAEYSPILREARQGVPYHLGVGTAEPAGFRAQTHAFASHLAERGQDVVTQEVEGATHLGIVEEFGRPGAAAFEFITSKLERTQ